MVPSPRLDLIVATAGEHWLAALRVLWITDGDGDVTAIERTAAAAIEGGVRAVQLREPQLSAHDLATLCTRLLPRLEAVGGLLIVNDRVDIAAAGLAHGAQVGHRSLPAAAARLALPRPRRLGVSVHEAGEIDAAAAAGADFAILAPIWPTASKPGHSGLGVPTAAAWTAAAKLPVLWLGGVDASRAGVVAGLPPAARPAGVAVRSAIGRAAAPAAAAASIVRAFREVFPVPSAHG